jgi:hypothetical protein
VKRAWHPGVLVAFAGVLTGVWLGKPPSGGISPVRDAQTERGGARNRSGRVVAAGTERTFAALMRQLAHADGIPAAGYRSIERATNRELRELLRTIAAEKVPGRPHEARQVKRRTSLTAAAAELFRREGAACLEWAWKLENPDLSLAVMTAAAGQDPALMKEWIVKFGGHWEPWSASGAIAAAEREAAMRSVEDLLAVETLFSGSVISDFRGFAEGFDFRSYLKSTRSPSGGETAYRYWAAQDPGAAAEALREGLGANPYHRAGHFLRPAMEGRAEVTNDTEAAGWICGIVEDLTGESRAEAIRGLAGQNSTPAQLQALMQQLPTDDDRVNFAAASLRVCSMESAAPLLEALPSQAMQVEALGRWAQGPNSSLRDYGAGRLEEMMDHLELPDDQRDELRAKLPQAR